MPDYTKIEELPDLPLAIKDAVNNNKLVVFIGAGVSRIIGCIGWSELALRLINVCYETQNKDNTATCISFKEKESLSYENDHKKVITICYYILCEKNGFKEIFYREFEKSLNARDEKKDKYNIYKEIWGLRGINITTNADMHYDDFFIETNRIYNFTEFSPSSIDPKKLYKIHGSRDNRESLVFTVPQYLKRYKNKEFRDFLSKIFSGDYTVLFLGYGMSEFELIDFLITKFGIENDQKERKYFILLPFYSGEENILSYEQSYYHHMGIQVIGYEKDKKGYLQLYHVLKKWNADINKTSTYTLDSYKELENLISEL